MSSKALSVGAQFNGYNCDANFHSRFPGKELIEIDSQFFCGLVDIIMYECHSKILFLDYLHVLKMR